MLIPLADLQSRTNGVGGDLWRAVVQSQRVTSLVVPRCSAWCVFMPLHCAVPVHLKQCLESHWLQVAGSSAPPGCPLWSPSWTQTLCLVLIWQGLKNLQVKSRDMTFASVYLLDNPLIPEFGTRCNFFFFFLIID